MSYPPMLPVMYIGTADARVVDLKTNIVRAREFGDGSLFESDILDAAKDERIVFLRAVSSSSVVLCPGD